MLSKILSSDSMEREGSHSFEFVPFEWTEYPAYHAAYDDIGYGPTKLETGSSTTEEEALPQFNAPLPPQPPPQPPLQVNGVHGFAVLPGLAPGQTTLMIDVETARLLRWASRGTNAMGI